MREEQFYFSSTEYRVMLALAGDRVLSPEFAGQPEEREIIQALHSLFERGVLKREGDDLIPDGYCGSLFSDMNRAERTVYVQAVSEDHPVMMICPVNGRLIFSEPVSDREDMNFRVFEGARSDLQSFLLNAGILEEPFLADEDKKETEKLLLDDSGGYAAAYFEDRKKNGSKPEEILYCRRYRNETSEVTGEYAVCTDGIYEVVLSMDDAGTEAELYTEGSLERMLTRCF